MRKVFKPLGELLTRYAGDIARHAHWINLDVAPLWLETVGPQAAAHLRPVQYRAGILLIHADGSIWANWMRTRQAELMKRLHGRAPLTGLRNLSVRIVPAGSGPVGHRAAKTRLPTMTNRARDTIRNTAKGVVDPELRNALERLARIPEAGEK